jgi:lipopolysaccharide export system permease protein
MKRIINLYIIREIATLFLLGISVFTVILLMGRLIKLTDLVIARGVPLADVTLMIVYLMPSFLVYTIPMAFLLSVLLAFGRLSADNEITVMKAGGISLMQLMPPVLLCGLCAAVLTLAASTFGVPWGNNAFKRLTFNVLKQNISATIREKVFWDDIPGIVMYAEHYDERQRALKGVLIHDGREKSRSMTIFAADGVIGGGSGQQDIRMVLNNGSIHVPGKDDEYRLVNFGEYVMTISGAAATSGLVKSETDMSIGQLRRRIAHSETNKFTRFKMQSELHSRFAFPLASLVFAIVAVPLGMQNRRSGKSGGFSTSIGVLLTYYVVLSFLRTLAEKGTIPPMLALWIPNLLFLCLGWFLLRMVSQERSFSLAALVDIVPLKRKVT